MSVTRSNFDGKFPTAKEIREITDLDELQRLFDSLTVDASHLETRLEFLSDDELDKERGIRNALSFARSAIRAVESHQKHLASGKSGPDVATLAKSREARVVAAAERSKAEAEIAKAKRDSARQAQRIQEVHIRAKLLKTVSWHVCFVRAARQILSADDLTRISNMADADYLDRLQEEANPYIRSDN